jgi:hypothetical protein
MNNRREFVEQRELGKRKEEIGKRIGETKARR